MRILRPLDRYVFSEFWKIFIVTGLGFPLLLVVTDLTENIEKYLNRHISSRDLVLSYIYFIPDSMFMVLPAAVLFATVFSIGAFTRHAEVTAAKASGISFYRLILPIFVGAVFACGLDLVLGEISPITNSRRSALLQEDKAQVGTSRFNFAYSGEYGRVYKAFELRTDSGQMHWLQIERKGSGASYPTYLLTADTATYDARNAAYGSPWTLKRGDLNIITDTGPTFTISFASARDVHLTERPAEMMAKPPDPHNMRYKDITRFINAIERSGGDANVSRVERALKIAVPVTCIIIALFGAPLATSTQRGGSAYGIAVSLATTMIFLLMIQLTKAVGSKGVITPDLAAWIPGILFGMFGLVLLARVRT
ncbi:MAG: permease YjgP/YjgQ family protein [Gemmatimonadetes bacterium]|nr:permease YjgP/YjgQ family protein [Gemmatimonadota bacterium]